MRDEAVMVSVSRRALVVALVVAALVGMAAKTLLFPDASTPARAIPATRGAVPPGPTRVDASGRPAGFAHSRVGAVAAAVSFVTEGDRVLNLGPGDAAAFLASMAAHQTAASFVSQQQAAFDALRNAVAAGSGPTGLYAAVADTRLDAYTPARARVRLWRVLVVSRQGMTSPGEQWAIVTYQLVWQAGDWHVWSEADAAGPTPAMAGDPPASPAGLETTLSGFAAYPGVG
jgi:hypothetical protein